LGVLSQQAAPSSTSTPGSGQTQLWSNNLSDTIPSLLGAGNSQKATSTGAFNISWTTTNTTFYAISGVRLSTL